MGIKEIKSFLEDSMHTKFRDKDLVVTVTLK
jgi:hypothetical protein